MRCARRIGYVIARALSARVARFGAVNRDGLCSTVNRYIKLSGEDLRTLARSSTACQLLAETRIGSQRKNGMGWPVCGG